MAPGAVHALLGENGAGKSTLVKCIMGYHRADEGRMRLGDQDVAPRSPRDAQSLGIGMVYQHFTLVPNMTVCENLVLSRAHLPFVFDWAKEKADLAAFLKGMPFAVDLDAPVRSLAAGERQKIEILKQLYLKSRIIILDEPTSVLTPAEADEVLSVIHGMAHSGAISVDHHHAQVPGSDAVRRRGHDSAQGREGRGRPRRRDDDGSDGGDHDGRRRHPWSRRRARPLPGASLLRVVGLSADDDAGVPAVREVTFEARRGEIVGVAAIAGNGQEELVEVLAGQRPPSGGKVVVDGRDFVPTREELRARKVRCLPEEPLRNACVPSMSVAENMALRVYDRLPYAVLRWFLSPKAFAATADRLVAAYGIRAPSIHSPIGQLSGGNVQRAVLARELSGEVDVLVAANPCMGLDFAAVSEIHARIRQARDKGAAVLLVSADLEEVVALADRILVMSEGRIVHETPADRAELAVLGRYMAGHH